MLAAMLWLIVGTLMVLGVFTIFGVSFMASVDEKRRDEAARIEEGRAAAERVRRSEPARPSPIDRFLAG